MAGNTETTTTSSDSEILNKRNDSPSSSNRSTPELDIPQPSSSCSGIKRSANEDANEDTNKRMKNNEPELNIKPDPDAPAAQDINQPIKTDFDGAASESTNQPSFVMPIIKSDPDGPSSSTNSTSAVLPVIKSDPDGPSCSTNSTSPTTVKSESVSGNDSTSSVSSPVTPIIRVVCQYGIRCYRNTPDHRRNFAHPGDSDYRRPDFLPAPDTAPDCEYGASCYRRNPQHFSGKFILLNHEFYLLIKIIFQQISNIFHQVS